MKKILLILTILSSLMIVSCAAAPGYNTPFDTGGKTYKVAMLPWRASTMNFTFKYRWTMTQALKEACKQSGAFVYAWSAYPVNGGDIPVLEKFDGQGLWVKGKYNKYTPDVDAVLKALSKTDVDLALLYDISADNGSTDEDGSMYSRSDYIRAFLIDLKTKQVTVQFIRTDFQRGMAFSDAKRVNLFAFSSWLSDNK